MYVQGESGGKVLRCDDLVRMPGLSNQQSLMHNTSRFQGTVKNQKDIIALPLADYRSSRGKNKFKVGRHEGGCRV